MTAARPDRLAIVVLISGRGFAVIPRIDLRAGETVAWNLPPAAGDIDHDGEIEIILTGPRGIYAFEADGTGVRDIEPGAVGLYQDLPGCSLPPILLPVEFPENGEPMGFVSTCVVVTEDGIEWLSERQTTLPLL